MFFRKSSKAQARNEETPSAKDQRVLAADQFTFMNLRHWSDLDEEVLPSLRYGFIEIVDTVPLSLQESDKRVSAADFQMMRRYSLAVGICRKAHFQYKVFDYNCSALLDTLDFDENGTVSFAGGTLTDKYTQVNALWQNAIVSGQKFLHWLETDLGDRFGRGSDEHKGWQEALSAAADVSLVVDMCYRNPAIVERDFLFLNMANVDFANSRTGFSIGIDRGFMDHDLGDVLRAKITSITKDRQARGLSPQLTVVDMMGRFRAQVALLYSRYLDTMMKDADKASSLVDRLYEDEHLNCVVRTVSGVNPSRLVYRMPAASMVEYYVALSNHIREMWSD